MLLALEPNNLLNVGEAISGYLDPGWRSPDCEDEVGLDLGDVDSPPIPASCSLALLPSVWVMVIGLERSELTFPPSRLVLAVWETPPDFPLTLESMLLELERCELREATPLEDFAGLGRERYWRDTLDPPQLIRMASS